MTERPHNTIATQLLEAIHVQLALETIRFDIYIVFIALVK